MAESKALKREYGMTLTRVKLENFTAFDELDLPLSPGINVKGNLFRAFSKLSLTALHIQQ
jgi:hypothetical protein